MLSSANSMRMAAGVSLATLSLVGCEPRQLGVNFADKQATSVNNTWVSAAKSCWPDLAHGYSDEALKQYLADPLHIRSAFATYSAMSDADLRAVVAKSVMSAPAPDATVLTHSQTAVITRSQAVYANTSLATANTADGAAPPDALCAVRPGTPVGFR